MNLEQQSDLVLSVFRGQNDRWHVIVDEFQRPLASFDCPHDACAWAIARAKDARGKVFVENTPVDYSVAVTRPRPASSTRLETKFGRK